MSTTLILAIWGAVLSTILAIIEIVKFRRDRAHIIVTVRGGYSVHPVGPPYGDNVYISISAANRGRRPVTLRSASLLMPRGHEHRYLLCGDSIRVKEVELQEGKSHNYMMEEEGVTIPPGKYVACVIDVTGRYYWSHNFLLRLIKLGRIR